MVAVPAVMSKSRIIAGPLHPEESFDLGTRYKSTKLPTCSSEDLNFCGFDFSAWANRRSTMDLKAATFASNLTFVEYSATSVGDPSKLATAEFPKSW